MIIDEMQVTCHYCNKPCLYGKATIFDEYAGEDEPNREIIMCEGCGDKMARHYGFEPALQHQTDR